EVTHSQPVCASSNRYRLTRLQSATSIAEQDSDAVSARGDDVVLAIAIHIGDGDVEKGKPKIEWRTTLFGKLAPAITEQHSHCIQFVMRSHDVHFAIAVEIADRGKPWLTGAEWKFAGSKATFAVGQ